METKPKALHKPALTMHSETLFTKAFMVTERSEYFHSDQRLEKFIVVKHAIRFVSDMNLMRVCMTQCVCVFTV